jgi:heme-degrading monooxygenase HmoA
VIDSTPPFPIEIVWEFRVTPEHEAAFEAIYGPEGAWAELFRRDPGFLGTELLRDVAERGRYLTIDRWTSPAAFESFRRRWAEEYEALDQRCEPLTQQELAVGSFVVPDP